MLKLAISSQLSLEKVIIRLQRITEFKEILGNLAPVISILNETENRLSDFVPEVATGIGEANSLLNELSSEVEVPSQKNNEPAKINDDVKKVLEESSILAEQRLKEQFPELPEFFSDEYEKSRIALTSNGEEIPVHEQIFSYLKGRDGGFSISKIASRFKVPEEEVRKAIKYLEKEGKIVVEK